MTLVIERPSGLATIDRLVPSDVVDLLAMYDRCSPETRYRRWHGHLHAFPAAYLSTLVAAADEHIAVVARHDSEVIGFASAAETAPATREIGILVEDRWQRRGVGRMLQSLLLAESVALGTRYVRAEVLASDAWLVDALRKVGPTSVQTESGIITAQVQLWA
jgi:GNAT superfamily N-acetyltransferase